MRSVNICSSPSRNSMELPESEEAALRTFDFLETAAKPEEKSGPSAGADPEAPWNDDKLPDVCFLFC